MRRAEKLLLAAILLACAALRFWPLQFDYFHPDETIAVGVAHHLVERGTLDTNWKNADLPPDFKLPQYNFSGYMLSAGAVDGVLKTVTGRETRNTLWALRLWSAMLALGVAALTFMAARRFFGVPTALVATALVAVNPLLVQDGFYARPEPFVTALTLIVILGGPRRAPLFWRVFAAAVIAGVLIATKISLIALLPLLFLPEREDAPYGAYVRCALKEAPIRAVAVLAGGTAGFMATAPFAILNQADYMEGLAFLLRQYNAPQWPYGLGEASTPARLAYVVSYFGATAGALTLIMAVAGAAWTAAARNFRALGVFLCCFAFAVWFATYPTFFERNFSHIVPVALIFAAYDIVCLAARLPRAALRIAAVLTVFVIAAYPAARMTYLLLAEEVSGQSWRDLGALRHALTTTYDAELTILDAREDYKNLEDGNFRLCGRWLIEMPHYHGIRSDAALTQVAAATGFKEVGRFTSHFAYVPTSSLHTYVMPTRVYLFRDNEADACEPQTDVADPRSAGAALPLRNVDAEPAWTKGGAYPTYVGFAPEIYYGTWSWVGGPPTGTLRITADVSGQTEVLLPYLTGADAHAQSVRITERTTGAEILKLAPLPASARWSYRRVALPSGTDEIIIEATDAGASATEWYAIAPPLAAVKGR
ncbi:MAG: hypothetical protein LCH56_00615 [Proteobacteria bacterium]|nr:hypothetical protein [Pseudomonadota bacterium]